MRTAWPISVENSPTCVFLAGLFVWNSLLLSEGAKPDKCLRNIPRLCHGQTHSPVIMKLFK
jgi:hypothetical protein